MDENRLFRLFERIPAPILLFFVLVGLAIGTVVSWVEINYHKYIHPRHRLMHTVDPTDSGWECTVCNTCGRLFEV